MSSRNVMVKLDMNLTIHQVLTKKQIDSLIYYSNNDPQILKFTHDSERFKNMASFNNWFSRDIQIFTLTNELGELQGLIWIKPKSNAFSKYQHTFAIRIYKDLRGKGYSYIFAKDVFKKIKINGLWLSVNKDNLAALKLYRKLKFKQIGIEQNQIIMELGF